VSLLKMKMIQRPIQSQFVV